MICQLCSQHEACGTYIILSSHPFSEIHTEMDLCFYCIQDLRDAQVKLRRVRGMPLHRIKLPIREERSTEKLRNKS